MVGKEAGVWRQSGVKWSWVWGKRAWGQWVLVSGGKSSLRSSEVRLVAPFVCPIAARDRWVIDFPLHDDSSLFFFSGIDVIFVWSFPEIKIVRWQAGQSGHAGKRTSSELLRKELIRNEGEVDVLAERRVWGTMPDVAKGRHLNLEFLLFFPTPSVKLATNRLEQIATCRPQNSSCVIRILFSFRFVEKWTK